MRFSSDLLFVAINTNFLLLLLLLSTVESGDDNNPLPHKKRKWMSSSMNSSSYGEASGEASRGANVPGEMPTSAQVGSTNAIIEEEDRPPTEPLVVRETPPPHSSPSENAVGREMMPLAEPGSSASSPRASSNSAGSSPSSSKDPEMTGRRRTVATPHLEEEPAVEPMDIDETAPGGSARARRKSARARQASKKYTEVDTTMEEEEAKERAKDPTFQFYSRDRRDRKRNQDQDVTKKQPSQRGRKKNNAAGAGPSSSPSLTVSPNSNTQPTGKEETQEHNKKQFEMAQRWGALNYFECVDNCEKTKTKRDVIEMDYARLRESEISQNGGKRILEKLEASSHWNCPKSALEMSKNDDFAFERHWWENSLASCHHWEELQAHTVRWLKFVELYGEGQDARDSGEEELVKSVAVFPSFGLSAKKRRKTGRKSKGKEAEVQGNEDDEDEEGAADMLDSYYLAIWLLNLNKHMVKAQSIWEANGERDRNGNVRRASNFIQVDKKECNRVIQMYTVQGAPKWHNKDLCQKIALLAKFYAETNETEHRAFLLKMMNERKKLLSGNRFYLDDDFARKVANLLKLHSHAATAANDEPQSSSIKKRLRFIKGKGKKKEGDDE